MTSYTPQRQALGEAFIGDTALAKNLFASPQTLDQRLLSLLQGLGQLDETLLSSAISGSDLAGLLREIHATSQADRIAWVQRLSSILAANPTSVIFPPSDDLVNTVRWSGATSLGSLDKMYPSVNSSAHGGAQSFGVMGTFLFLLYTQVSAIASSARQARLYIGPSSALYGIIQRTFGSGGVMAPAVFEAGAFDILAVPTSYNIYFNGVFSLGAESSPGSGLGEVFIDFTTASGDPITYAEFIAMINFPITTIKAQFTRILY